MTFKRTATLLGLGLYGVTLVANCGDGICGMYESYANCAGTSPVDCNPGTESGYCSNSFDDDEDGLTDCDDSDCTSDSNCETVETCSAQSGYLLESGQTCGGTSLEASDGDCCSSTPLCEVGALIPYGNTCDCQWGSGSGGVTWSTEEVPIWCCDSGTYSSGPCPDIGGECPIDTKLDYDTSLYTQCVCGDTDAALGNCGSDGWGTYGYYCCDTDDDGVGDVCQESDCSTITDDTDDSTASNETTSLTCSDSSGETCTSDQLCVGEWAEVNDTSYCCIGTCSSSGCVSYAVDGPDYIIATAGTTGTNTNYCVNSYTRGVYYCEATDSSASSFEGKLKEIDCVVTYGADYICDSADVECKTVEQQQQDEEERQENEETTTNESISDETTDTIIDLTPEQIEELISSENQTDEVSDAIISENGSASCLQGCLYSTACYPIGIRETIDEVNSYCNVGLSEDGDFVYLWESQKEEDSLCDNHYECRSNFCIDDKCFEQGLITRVIDWIKNWISMFFYYDTPETTSE